MIVIEIGPNLKDLLSFAVVMLTIFPFATFMIYQMIKDAK